MSRARDRWIQGWDRLLPASMFLGAVLMFLEWRRQRRRLRRQVELHESGWESPDA